MKRSTPAINWGLGSDSNVKGLCVGYERWMTGAGDWRSVGKHSNYVLTATKREGREVRECVGQGEREGAVCLAG